jgi:hypothetical protein
MATGSVSEQFRHLYNVLKAKGLLVSFDESSLSLEILLPFGIRFFGRPGRSLSSSYYFDSNYIRVFGHGNTSKCLPPSAFFYFFGEEQACATAFLNCKSLLDSMMDQVISAPLAFMGALRRSRVACPDVIRMMGRMLYGAEMRSAMAELGGH